MKNLFIIGTMLISLTAWSQNQFQNETVGMLTYTSGKVIQLAEAIPEDNYSWRPADSVRSIGEVLAHIVSANYFFATKMGAAIPETVNMQTIEQDLKTREAIMAGLKESYQIITNAIKNTSDEGLTKKVEFPFPGEYTMMTAALIGLTHTNEHLGQLIAYSRSNNITPPWSQGMEE